MYHNSQIDEIMDRAGGRTMYVSADTGDKLTLSYYGDAKSFTFNGGSNLTDSLSIGNTTMSSIEMELIYDPSQTVMQERITDGARIELNIEVKLDNGGIGTIPMGVFYAINPELIGVSSDGKETYSVKANDGMCKKTGLYVSDLTYPTNWWAVWQELGGVDNKGFKAELEALSDYELLIDNPIPSGYTKREMIGFIAAKVGRFACYDRHGKLTAHYYGEEADVVKPTKVFYDFKKSAKVTVGTVVVNKDSDTKFTATTGVGGITLSNSNPLGTQEATNKIAQKMATLEYNIANATILGDFRIDCWDIISVEYLDNITYKIPAMSLTHDMSGGIKTSIASVGSSATEDEADYSGPVIKAIERTNAELLTVNELIAGKATIEQLNATNANVTNLQTNKLDANMANINVANIDVAKVGSMFAQVGLIDRATISEGHITGYLDSVEVNANNITAGTLVADRLLLKNGNNYVGFTTDGTNVVKADIDADDIIKDHTITADHIVAHTITANEVDVASLTADSAFINAISTNSVVVGAMNTANSALSQSKELATNGYTINSTDTTILQSKTIPDNNSNYARLDMLGGMSKKVDGVDRLLDAKVDKVVMQGKNLFDKELELGSINGAGKKVSSTTRFRSTDYVSLAKGTYTITVENMVTNSTRVIVYTYINGQKTNTPSWQTTPYTFTLTEDCEILFAFQNTDQTITTIDMRNCQIEKGTVATDYAPYNHIETPIPQSIINKCTDYGIGISDSCYNYIDFAEKKYHHKVGSRAYQSGDEDNASYLTNGTTTYYPLATEEIIDLSDVITTDMLLKIEAGGTLNFHYPELDNGYVIDMPNKEAYMSISETSITLNNGLVSLKTEVDGIEIGGRNLQLGTENWADSCFWAKTGVVITDDTMKVELGKYPRLALIPVKPKEEYTLSVDIKSDIAHDETVTNKPILLDYYNSSNARVVYENIPIASRVETDWNRYSYTFVVPDDSNITQLSISPRSGDTYVHYFRHLKLERGNKSTDYSPAPEDSEAYADSAVKVVTDNIYTPNTTTIDGGKITTSSIKSEQIDVDNLFAQEIEASGYISVNNTETGSNIKLQNGNIIISGTSRGLMYEVGKIEGRGSTNFVNAYGNWLFDHIPYLHSTDVLGLFNVAGVKAYTSANYRVEKYIDGRMRMIYKETQTLNISSASGNIKYADVSTPDFPEEFIEAPVIVWSTNSQGGNAWIWGRTAPTKTNSGGAYVGRGSANSSVKLDVIFVAEGYWK